MIHLASYFVVGVLFALGLGMGGMTDPHRVQGFLDIFGDWDPSLAFVMMGAVCLHVVTYRFIRKRATPMISAHWHIPERKDLNAKLIGGSLMFGAGWGLAGYCPGPALTSLTSLDMNIFIFVGCMILGMITFSFVDRFLTCRNPKNPMA